MIDNKIKQTVQNKLRETLKFHGLTKHGDGVVEADIMAILEVYCKYMSSYKEESKEKIPENIAEALDILTKAGYTVTLSKT